MSDESIESDPEDKILLNLELSDREHNSIGRIVSLWGAIEHEIFFQTLDSLNDSGGLPKDMNNLQSSKVMELWKSHVIDRVDIEQRKILQDQYVLMKQFSKLRNAIVHGMWEWSMKNPDRVDVFMVRKGNIDRFNFTVEDLEHFALALARINYRIRYPRGFEDRATDLEQSGSYISRSYLRKK